MKYRVIGKVNHNNKDYLDGETIELTAAEASPLLNVKAVEPYSQPFEKQAPANPAA